MRLALEFGAAVLFWLVLAFGLPALHHWLTSLQVYFP